MKVPLFKFLLKNYDKILMVVILAIAAFYRFYRISDFITFLGDEGRDVLVVYKILHGDLTLLGPTASVGGFFLGPIYYYFMAPFLWLFNYNPVGPAVMVAIFGIATVWLIYKIGKEFFSPVVGLIASGLYAISPLVVIYSRSSWNPNLMPFFSLLTLYLVHKAVIGRSVKFFILSGFLLGITMQLHYLALFLGTIIFFYILTYLFVFSRSNIFINATKQYLYIFIGFILGWSPFLVFEIRHGFVNILSIFTFVFNSGDTGGGTHFFDTVNNVFFRLFGKLVTNFPIQEQIPLESNSNIAIWYYGTLILGIVSSTFLLLKTFQSYKSSSNFAKYSLLLIWLILGVGLFGFYKKSIYDYYFGFMFPLPFLIIGLLFMNIWKKRFGKIMSTLIVLIIIGLNSLTIPFLASANRQLNQIQEISRFVLDKAENKPFNFGLITYGNSDHAYRYFFTIWNKEPTIIQNESIDPQRKTVEDQLLVVCETTPPCQPLGNSIWEIAGFGRAEIAEEWDVSVVKVYKLVHFKE